jgi:hypothetical protein
MRRLCPRRPLLTQAVRLLSLFASQLDSLSPRCRESRDDLAGSLKATRQILAQDGYPESLASVADGVDASVPASVTGFDCQGAMAAYVVTREQG